MLIDKPIKRLVRLNTKDCLWPYILRILKDKPMHAYIIRAEINRRFGFFPGQVTSYTTLYSLKRKGYVSKEKKGRIIIYRITEKGKQALKQARDLYKDLYEKLI